MVERVDKDEYEETNQLKLRRNSKEIKHRVLAYNTQTIDKSRSSVTDPALTTANLDTIPQTKLAP